MRKKSEQSQNRLPNLYHEKKANRIGYRCVAGVDEAGRGPLAGPVVAASCVLKNTRFKARINDSKKLTPKKRLLAYKEIIKKAWVGVGIVDEKKIDNVNIYNATAIAMEKAVKSMGVVPDFLLIDGRVNIKVQCKKTFIIKGDTKSVSIACASIVAKVTRDKIMDKHGKTYPKYGFGKHKGYGTKEHMRLIAEYGPTPIHRRSFNPVKNILKVS